MLRLAILIDNPGCPRCLLKLTWIIIRYLCFKAHPRFMHSTDTWGGLGSMQAPQPPLNEFA